MLRRRIAAAAIALTGCNGQAPAPNAPAPWQPSAATPTTTPTATPEPVPPAAPTSTEDARCEEPCLFLATTPRAHASAEFTATCGADPWFAGELDCGQLDYERNCIYAAHGYAFKDPRWADTFRPRAWYRPKDSFTEADLPDAAVDNAAALKKLGATCHEALAAEKRLADKWTTNVLAGTPDVPLVGFDCSFEQCARISRSEMTRAFAGSQTWSLVTLSSDLARMAPSAETRAAFPRRKLAALDITFEGHCADEEGCPRAFRLVFDEKHSFVALERLPTAACPFVYSLTEQPIFVGEILRNLDRAGLERDDSLTLSMPSCSGEKRIRIAEEKDEVTSLDAVELLVDGVAVAPTACADGEAPYCANDGRALTLARGEHLDLAFAIPPGATCSSVELRANGHYTRVSR